MFTDLFHNNQLPQEFKEEIKGKILEQGEDLLDCAMTYSLFDWMKENADDFINRIPELAKVCTYLISKILMLRHSKYILEISE